MVDAEKTLSEFLDDILDEKGYKPRNVKIEPVSTGGANYTSVLFLVTVSSPGRDELKLFAKVACVGENMRGHMNADWFYATERRVYTELVKIYKDIENEFNVADEDRYVFPEFYGCKDEMGKETVVMENMIESGYKSFDRFKPMDFEHACAGIENVAKFHALSFAFAKHYPEEFNKFTVGMSFNMPNPGDMEGDGSGKNMLLKIVEKSLLLIKEEYKGAIRGFVFNPNNRFDIFNGPIGHPVIAHGDYRMSNLLFKREGDKLKAIAVDYQTVNAGNPVSDIVYFITLGTDAEFRRKYLQKLLDHYYKSLGEALKRLSVNLSEVYPRKKFQRDLKKLMPYSILLGILILPVVMVDAEAAPKVDGDSDVDGFFVKSGDLYNQRFIEIAEDFMKL